MKTIDGFKLTEKAISHFNSLVSAEDTEGVNLRLTVVNPSTPLADINLTYCYPGEQEKTDIQLKQEQFVLFIGACSVTALTDAIIDYEEDENSKGKLSVKAPNIKGHAPSDDKPLKERIQYLFDTEVNISLASHGGSAEIIDIIDESILLIKFAGGCQGCGMASITLTQGIEQTIKTQFPEISEVRDITEHDLGENPYY